MKASRLKIGLRSRLCHLSIVVVAALAAVLARMIDREVAATIRSSSVALLDQAQPVVAARAAALLDRRAAAELERMLRGVVSIDPFELVACFDLDGSMRAVASRSPLTADQTTALRAYGSNNAIGALQRAWQPAGMRFFQHPMWDTSRDAAPRGTLLLTTNPPAVERRIGILRRYLWAAALLGGGVAVLAVLVLARALTQPLLALVNDVHRLERGIPAVRLATSRRDEIGGLARAFGQMADDVQNCRLDLKRKGELLAQAVAQRKQNLGRTLRELKELGQRKDSFLSSISHEFRTPLTVMRSSAEILVEDGNPGTVAEFLPGIREHALSLDRVVDNLLCMLDLERCQLVAAPDPTTLGAIVGAALAEIEPERGRRSVAIVREFDGELSVRWDISLTVRLLRELVLNAVRFSPQGGRVWLSAGVDGSRVRVTIRDEGPGIPAEQCEEAFERFRQLGDVMTEKPRGTGLGLPICRAIAVLHGGWVRAEPHAESGACLILELPVDASAGTHAPESPAWVLGELRP